MSNHDFNGDGKHDINDDIIGFAMYDEVHGTDSGNKNKHVHNSKSGISFGKIILGFIISFFANAILASGLGLDFEDIPSIVYFIFLIIGTAIFTALLNVLD